MTQTQEALVHIRQVTEEAYNRKQIRASVYRKIRAAAKIAFEQSEAEVKIAEMMLEAAKTALEDIDMALSGECDISDESLEATKSTLETAIEAYNEQRSQA